MAKYETYLHGNFDEILGAIDQGILRGSVSASLEDGSNYGSRGVRCAVRVYERFSYMGGNRVSLNVTLLDDGQRVFLSAITAGGSKAVFFKINTIGEESFLNCLVDIARRYQ